MPVIIVDIQLKFILSYRVPFYLFLFIVFFVCVFSSFPTD